MSYYIGIERENILDNTHGCSCRRLGSRSAARKVARIRAAGVDTWAGCIFARRKCSSSTRSDASPSSPSPARTGRPRKGILMRACVKQQQRPIYATYNVRACEQRPKTYVSFSSLSRLLFFFVSGNDDESQLKGSLARILPRKSVFSVLMGYLAKLYYSPSFSTISG